MILTRIDATRLLPMLEGALSNLTSMVEGDMAPEDFLAACEYKRWLEDVIFRLKIFIDPPKVTLM